VKRANWLQGRLEQGLYWGVDYRQIITIEPGKRGGKPCIRGLRITVGDVLGWLAAVDRRGHHGVARIRGGVHQRRLEAVGVKLLLDEHFSR